MGQRLLSLKGASPIWRGKSSLSVNDRGMRRFLKMENCYVNRDGSEIRSFPGYGVLLDLTEIHNTNGYARYVPDAVRPLLEFTSPGARFKYAKVYDPTDTQTLYARAKPKNLFAFEQIGGEIVIIGESRFREVPVFTANASSSGQATVSQVDGTLSTWRFTFSGTISAASTWGYDAGSGGTPAFGGNHALPGMSVYAEGFTSSDAAEQAILDAEVNGKVHLVGTVTTTSISVTTTTSNNVTIAVTDGELHIVRNNRADYYPSSPDRTVSPYDDTYTRRIDDPDALTAWRVQGYPSMGSSSGYRMTCWPSWVANRTRDFGDLETRHLEGIIVESTPTGDRAVSRREGKRLPYRPSIEPAMDRIILAAPKYGCMFQIPLRVGIDPANWTSPSTTSDRGIPFPANNIYDKPRSLGIPKPRLIVSVETAVAASPSVVTPANFNVVPVTGLTSASWPEGTFKVAISFEDSGTGDEGLASETMEVTVPAVTSNPYTIAIYFMHPGYVMPECSVDKVNVYIALPDEEALGFYDSFEIENRPSVFDDDASGFYGAGDAVQPQDADALYRRIQLQIPDTSPSLAELETAIDFTRLAPQSATMPRGASACKFIRGVLFSGGAIGNAGSSDQLWRSKASMSFIEGNVLFGDEDVFAIRSFGAVNINPETASVDGDYESGQLGIAGRCFPDAYQGIEFVARDLLPRTDSRYVVDRVVNRLAVDTGQVTSVSSPHFYHHERIRATEPLLLSGRPAGSTPLTDSVSTSDKDIFFIMPRGQVQIGDPGAPNRSSRAFIKLVDPARGDDITAIGQLGGNAVICTRKETYSYSWYRNPAGEEPNLMSNEFGCIAANSMVEFDGGLAWISERGPVAVGQGLQFIGQDVTEDFIGAQRRYLTDSRGMMRHTWSCHDKDRGLVMWGMVTSQNTATVSWEDEELTWATATTDEQKSRFACDEVLIWSYATGAFSTWRPPAGKEILWMRPITDADGNVRIAFLAADMRIYALDDAYADVNNIAQSATYTTTTAGSGTSITLATDGATTAEVLIGGVARGDYNVFKLLREGMLVEFLNSDGDVVAETTVASVNAPGAAQCVITLAASMTWTKGQTVVIGGRQRMRLVTNYIGFEAQDSMGVHSIQMRYSLFGDTYAAARVKVLKPEHDGFGSDAREVAFTKPGTWKSIAYEDSSWDVPLGQRIRFSQGIVDAEEVAVSVELTGVAQVRIQDISLEV